MEKLFSKLDSLSSKSALVIGLAGLPLVVLALVFTSNMVEKKSAPKTTATGVIEPGRAIGLAKENIGQVFYLDRPADRVRFDDGGQKDRAAIAYITKEDAEELKSNKLAFSYLLLEERSTQARSRELAQRAAKMGGWKKQGTGWVAYALPGPDDTFPALFVVANDGTVFTRLVVSPPIRTDRRSQEKLLGQLRLTGQGDN